MFVETPLGGVGGRPSDLKHFLHFAGIGPITVGSTDPSLRDSVTNDQKADDRYSTASSPADTQSSLLPPVSPEWMQDTDLPPSLYR